MAWHGNNASGLGGKRRCTHNMSKKKHGFKHCFKYPLETDDRLEWVGVTASTRHAVTVTLQSSTTVASLARPHSVAMLQHTKKKRRRLHTIIREQQPQRNARSKKETRMNGPTSPLERNNSGWLLSRTTTTTSMHSAKLVCETKRNECYCRRRKMIAHCGTCWMLYCTVSKT